ncbi:MAG: hypothetical protein CL578_18390 [Alteromonadaceae bacterium]|jgi:hypothetical protein|uniref:MerR family transcriptional regulator n=2 Tax=Paraglaciecola TaxID=1621534 RepID=K6YIA3_9ALTE|nr:MULTISPECIES: DUF411 domain-containing protein [Alteromonadaceae]MBN26998.1 hypothetical protein [Alteromonadaceae bacterium]MBT0587024.1 DUF411 domain-containing protein [Alteromonas oceanisediminis]GAC03084.1 MerR family transcriptional regulator [Paraglaciecola agarilytica NO2]GAC23721.1 MerR family transcriptional regulator [Paraglaciecola mesophila KMM 241]|tara:strand:+ start:9074 stop:9589 length:516 start_codon:yes stop_codon:yes gene_type:complete
MKIITRRTLWIAPIFVLFLSACSDATQVNNDSDVVSDAPKISLEIYKSRSCKCCQKWVKHVKEHGFETDVTNVTMMSRIKDKYGVAPNYRSCHTALSADGLVFEGHVPAKFIQQFLESTPEGAIGLSVPAMPIGSPGMEVGDQFRPYIVLQLNEDGSATTYVEVKTYEEQF